MEEQKEETPRELDEISVTSSTDLTELSPSLQKIMRNVYGTVRKFRTLTPTKYLGRKDMSVPVKVGNFKTKDQGTEIAASSSVSRGTVEDQPHQNREAMVVEFQDTRSSVPDIAAPNMEFQDVRSSDPDGEASNGEFQDVWSPVVDGEAPNEEYHDTRTSGAKEEARSFARSQRSSSQEEKLVSKDLYLKDKRYAFWFTSEMYRGKDREQFIYLSIQEFMIYLIFLTSVSVVTFGSMTTIMYYYSMVLSDVFTETKFKTAQNIIVTFKDLKTIEQFWMFLKNPFINTLFLLYYEERLSMMTLTMEESKLVLLENIMVGVPRLRQVRVRPDSCKVPQYFSEIFRSCYGYYKPSTEDRKPFGLKVGSPWTYTEDIAIEYEGKISTYGTGGFYLNLTRNYGIAKQLIENLRNSLWINHGTRAVFVDFTLYTPNVNLFCVVKLVAEFPPSGGVITTSHFHTLKLIRYVSTWDHVILGFEVVSVAMLVLYTAEEIREMIILQWQYVWNLWNIIDIIIVILGWNVITMGYVRYSIISTEIPALIKTINTDDHGNFDSLSDVQKLFNTASACFVTIVWLKLIKYMMLIKVMYHLLKTIGKCAYELLGLTFILIILMISFSVLGHLLFGSQVEAFGTITQSLISLMILVVGGLDFKKVQEARPFLGPLYFMLFIYFFILIFLCLFVAVIVNGFTMVRFDILEDRNKIYLKNILHDFLINILNLLKLSGMANRLKEKIQRDKATENYYVIIDILRRSGFRGEEMKLFLKKYKIEKGKEISLQKVQDIYDDIDGKGQVFIEAIEHEQILNEFDLMRLRLAYNDKILEELASKIELLLAQVSR